MKIRLIKLGLDNSLRVFEDEGYLIDKALPYDEHRLIELARCLQVLKLLGILVLQDEVETVRVVEGEGQYSSS